MTNAKSVIGILVGTVVCTSVGYVLGKKKGFEKGYRDGHESGYKNGYREGNVDTAKKFNKSTKQHVIKVAGAFAIALYIGNLDGLWSENDEKATQEVLGNLYFQEEYVKDEVLKVYKTRPNFEEIKKLYLNEMNYKDLKELDERIRAIFFACKEYPSENEKIFYEQQWKQYLESRK
ncbi:hypothetical protein M3079_07025 [Phascolarctobacterium sp. ET69]|uniref:hypothetical protein n=1 Tax=Phascolarctobacterium sp. ET69 TaxID=2939420 RepID=UPI002010C92E|nr:hypothetical protein [Phascolarctobacterium sp. ET69]MCL1605728.1 hypothetical protein [Phascolarctobacterium sp. ET69]